MPPTRLAPAHCPHTNNNPPPTASYPTALPQPVVRQASAAASHTCLALVENDCRLSYNSPAHNYERSLEIGPILLTQLLHLPEQIGPIWLQPPELRRTCIVTAQHNLSATILSPNHKSLVSFCSLSRRRHGTKINHIINRLFLVNLLDNIRYNGPANSHKQYSFTHKPH